MTGNEFIRKVKKLGRERSVTVQFVARRGKGSHDLILWFTVYDRSQPQGWTQDRYFLCDAHATWAQQRGFV